MMRTANFIFMLGVLLVLLGMAGYSQAFDSLPTATPSPTVFNLTPLPPTISGDILTEKGPAANAIVQIQHTPNQTTTDANGRFALSGISGTMPFVLIAWAAGH